MPGILDDLRYGLRALSRTRGVAVVAVLSLALGIGANTTIFTLVNAILLRPLPVREPSRLVAVHTVDSRNPGLLLCSYPNYKDFRDRSEAFSSLLLYAAVTVNLTGRGDPQLLMGHLVTGNYFSTLGTQPIIGRGFLPEEDAAEGAAPVVVLSHRFWMRQFGGDPQITSHSISLNGRSYQIVGVAPPGFHGLNELYAADVWAPMAMSQRLYPNPPWVNLRRALLFAVVGRLKPGVTVAQASASMQNIAAQLEREYPKDNDGRRVQLTTVAEAALAPKTRGVVTNASAVLLIVSGLVLLIACANVANLLLARAAGRRKEITVRLALGAGRWVIIRQLLAESVVLSLAGAATGIALARWARDAIWALRPPMFNFADIHLDLDWRVLTYTLTVSLITGILFGLMPALRGSDMNLGRDLKERAGRSFSGGRWQLRSILVSTQVAFSVVALVGAGLFLRSMLHAAEIETGFDAAHLGSVLFNLTDQGYNEARARDYQQRALAAAGKTPGVVSATLSKDMPMHVSLARTVLLDGQENTASGAGRQTLTSIVWPGYFQTMGIPLMQGRDFRLSEIPSAPRTVIVNEAAASHFWPGESAIGKRMHFFGDPLPAEVIGVAHNAAYQKINETPQPLLYLSLNQYFFSTAVVIVRTAGDPGRAVGMVRREMQGLDRNLMLQAESVDKTIRESLWAHSLSGVLLAGFGLLALVLAAAGVYGVVSHAVTLRWREIGVRMALGATRGHVQRMVLLDGIRMVSIGVIGGLIIAASAASAVRGLLFIVSPYDGVTFVLAPAVLVLAGTLACWFPAWRATRVDPAIALRDE